MKDYCAQADEEREGGKFPLRKTRMSRSEETIRSEDSGFDPDFFALGKQV